MSSRFARGGIFSCSSCGMNAEDTGHDNGFFGLCPSCYEALGEEAHRMDRLHYHRCGWCGALMECSEACHADWAISDWEYNGKVLPDGHCSSECFLKKRPADSRTNMTADGSYPLGKEDDDV